MECVYRLLVDLRAVLTDPLEGLALPEYVKCWLARGRWWVGSLRGGLVVGAACSMTSASASPPTGLAEGGQGECPLGVVGSRA